MLFIIILASHKVNLLAHVVGLLIRNMYCGEISYIMYMPITSNVHAQHVNSMPFCTLIEYVLLIRLYNTVHGTLDLHVGLHSTI